MSVSPESFTVTLARSGQVFRVESGETILDVLRDAGVPVRASCEMGTCGACEVKVLDGIPDHLDAVLSPQDKRSGAVMMICCSGAKSDNLTLDL